MNAGKFDPYVSRKIDVKATQSSVLASLEIDPP
jgi:hypothetical protein